jgi:hypothetical protein
VLCRQQFSQSTPRGGGGGFVSVFCMPRERRQLRQPAGIGMGSCTALSFPLKTPRDVSFPLNACRLRYGRAQFLCMVEEFGSPFLTC